MTTAVGILIFTVLIFLAIRHLQRSFFYPRPPEMPAPVEESIDAALHRIEAALLEHAPEVHAALQPGLSNEEIAEIESRYRLRLSKELRALYRWRNGLPEDGRMELIPGKWFVPLEIAAQRREEIRRQAADATLLQRLVFFLVASHKTNWLVVLDDLCGDGYFYDSARRREVGVFYHFTEDRHYRFFPSLASFLIGAAECYEKGIFRGGSRGRTRENYERAIEVWTQYASMI